MKKLFALLCVVGVVLPYYNIYKFIEENNWEWSTALFFEQINMNYGMKILNADLTVAATTFLIFIIYKLNVKYISLKQFLKYFVSLFIVGFSLALPLYLFDNYNRD
jgi:FlaA1/EpsC-like NDP-sugar epimerase